MNINKFSREVRDELNKVVWPDRTTAIRTTIMVIVVFVVVALFFMGIDSILAYLVKIIF